MSELTEKLKFELKRHKARYILFGVLAMYYITSNIVMSAIGMTETQINVMIWFVIVPASILFLVGLYNLEKRYKLQGSITQ